MKGISTFLIILFFYLNAWAERDYTRVEARAERFVQFHEWNSANAMYMLLINSVPKDPKYYSRAIVTSGLISDDKAQVGLLEMTQRQGIPLDSIFAGVYKFAYQIGESQEYEHFLKLVKSRQPWMSRNINLRLLKYYDFRNDAINIVAVGKELLLATPNEVVYLLAVGRGYMLQGEYEEAVQVYKKVLELDENNYDALLALGNYYYVMWKEAEGSRSQFTETKNLTLKYLKKAYELSPTPFVKSIIEELDV